MIQTVYASFCFDQCLSHSFEFFKQTRTHFDRNPFSLDEMLFLLRHALQTALLKGEKVSLMLLLALSLPNQQRISLPSRFIHHKRQTKSVQSTMNESSSRAAKRARVREFHIETQREHANTHTAVGAKARERTSRKQR